MTVVQTSVDSQPPALDQLVRHIDDISTLPQIALRVMEVAGDTDSCAADLKEVMESDPALSARVLRCVNSSAYSVRTKIGNLQQAIAYLGMKQVRNLALTASVSDLFQERQTIESYSREGLWRHLMSVGICSRMIAMRRNIQNFEDAFLAGLLHDIGIVLEDQHVHPHFRKVIRSLSKEEMLVDRERAVLGFDHAALGGKVAERWKFPETVLATIRYHHMSDRYRGEALNVVYCVEVANLLCTLKGISSVGLKLLRFSPQAVRALCLTKEDIAVLAEDLDAELAQSGSLFQM